MTPTNALARFPPRYLTLVGGQEIKSASKTNNLYLLNLETLSFNMIITQGEAPPPRDGHRCGRTGSVLLAGSAIGAR